MASDSNAQRTDLTAAQRALLSYKLGAANIEPLGTGLINTTYLVTSSSGRYVLQCLNSLFDPAINLDIDALTRHLDSQGAVTQRLIPVADQPDRLWVEVDGENWRLTTFIPGKCLDRLDSEAQARNAGILLGQFHRQLEGLQLELHVQRPSVHDTARHLAALVRALDEHRTHRYYDRIAPLAEQVLAVAADLPLLPALPDRLVHGDPKISNLVFASDSGAGVCLIDLDTIAYMPLPLEIGDAVRSWCNPRGEDERHGQFRIDYFAAAIDGYASEAANILLPIEWQAFVPAAQTIMIELAARFTTDALRENYFGWNQTAFADRSSHNQVRAAGQLNLAQSFVENTVAADTIVYRAFDK